MKKLVRKTNYFFWILIKCIGDELVKKQWLSNLLSYSPIFNFSCPENFGDIDANTKGKKIFFSLICIKIGLCYATFISVKVDKQKLINHGNLEKYGLRIIRLERLQFIDYDKINKKYNEYEQYLEDKSDRDKQDYAKMLTSSINDLHTKEQSNQNKVNFYMVIITIFFSVYTSSFYFKDITKANSYSFSSHSLTLLLLIGLAYQFFNTFCFIAKYSQIKSFNEIKLSSQIHSSTPLNNRILVLYYNCLLLKNTTTLDVTLIKNIQKYILFMLTFTLLVPITYCRPVNFLLEFIVVIVILALYKYQSKSGGKLN
ncbi:hypothetical protein EFP30_09840 [Lactiplantibacillus pentosus]|uniref:hypothetical protein n=1 Tax=Lactiplantibacillus pentosus TaxID=1589 RepID=UPI0021A95E7B|nr:hypothetical protein [Lactiplantibacillus pentosus]MCT3306653.1 hypothetical protein [Lactiplantibacillus pentosus]